MPGPKAKNIKPAQDKAILWILSLFAETYAELEIRCRTSPMSYEQKVAALERAQAAIVAAAGRKFPRSRPGRPPSLMSLFRRLEVRKRVDAGETAAAAVDKAYLRRLEVRDGEKIELVSEPHETTIENYYRDRNFHALDDSYIAFFEAEVRKAMGEEA